MPRPHPLSVAWLIPLALLLLVEAAPAADATVAEPAPDPLLQARATALREALVGTWRSRLGEASLVASFRADGELGLPGRRGRWTVSDRATLLVTVSGGGPLAPAEYSAAIASGQLTLTGGGLGAPLIFARDPGLSHVFARWFGVEATTGLGRWWRLVGVLLWIALARLAIWLAQVVGRSLILSRRGPLRWIFPRRPLRAATLLSLSLNTAKYLVYAIGLGFVLSTFDVDYTTYLASLSVIGLAIGFGSQGLVQDMVTGVFILVESQFDVGDIVEISGHCGVVEEMGLRMTRLRTLQGQQVTVPNRSIATVARYGPRGLRCEISLPLPAEAAADRIRERVDATVQAVAEQFPAALLEHQPARIADHADGRRSLRCEIRLWPGQQQVLDGQLLPRLRSGLSQDAEPGLAESLAWHFDRPRIEQRPLPSWRRWLGDRRAAPP